MILLIPTGRLLGLVRPCGCNYLAAGDGVCLPTRSGFVGQASGAIHSLLAGTEMLKSAWINMPVWSAIGMRFLNCGVKTLRAGASLARHAMLTRFLVWRTQKVRHRHEHYGPK